MGAGRGGGGGPCAHHIQTRGSCVKAGDLRRVDKRVRVEVVTDGAVHIAFREEGHVVLGPATYVELSLRIVRLQCIFSIGQDINCVVTYCIIAWPSCLGEVRLSIGCYRTGGIPRVQRGW